MARIRTVKPTFFTSLHIAQLPDPTRLHFIGLWTYVDDAGRGVDDARLIKAAIWPLDDAKTIRKVEQMQKALADTRLIERYEVDGQRCFRVVKWAHQRIDKKQDSRLPPSPSEPGNGREPSGNDPGTLPPDGGNDPGTIREGSRPEGKGREGRRKGEEGKGKSSSSTSGQTGPAAGSDDDDGDSRPDPATEAAVTAAGLARLERREAEKGQVSDHAGWLATDRQRTLAALAEGDRSVLDVAPPGTNGAGWVDPLDASAAAQRALADRNEARRRGEVACGLCCDAGVVETETGDVRRCDCAIGVEVPPVPVELGTAK